MFNLSKTIRAPSDGAAPPKESPSASSALTPGHRRLVLVVDDNAVTRVLMGSRLRDAGFSAEVAAIVPATVERARHLRPDAVTLNLNVHEKAGFELLRHLRRELPESNSPVFVISDSNADRVESKAEKLGVTRVFRGTGSRPHEVIKALQDFFGLSQTHTVAPPASPHETEMLRASSTAPSMPTADSAATEARIASVRRELEILASCTRLEQQPTALTALLAAVEALKTNSQSAGLKDLALVTQVLTRLVQEFTTSPGGLTPTRRRMFERALEFLKIPVTAHHALTAPDGSTASWGAIIVEAPDMPCAAMIDVLRDLGFAPRKIGGPSALVPLLERDPADLVVLPLPQPAAAGCPEAEAIRKMPSHALTPLLFISASDQVETPAHVARFRPCDLIAGPVSMAEFAFKALMLVLDRRSNPAAAKSQRSGRITPPGRALVTGTARPTPVSGEQGARMDLDNRDLPVLDLTSATDLPIGERPDSLILRRGLLHVDDSWTICTVNDDGAALLGFPTAALPGRNLREWIILGLPASPAEAWSSANPFNSESGTVIMSLILRRQDNTVLPARFRLQKLGEGSETRWLVMLAPESATSSGSDTAMFTKAALAVDHPDDAAAQGAATADIQTDLLRRRIDELLTISTDDSNNSAAVEQANASAKSDEPKSQPEETPAEVTGESATLASPPEDETLAASQTPAAFDGAAPLTNPPEKPEPLAVDETEVAPSRKPIEPAVPAIASNDVEAMNSNFESAPASEANDGTSAAPCGNHADLSELIQERDELQRLVSDLDGRLQASMSALAAATAQVQREQSERRRQEQRAAQLGKRLEDLHEDLRQHLQSEAASSERSAALEEQLAQRGEAEAQLQAELERELGEKETLRADFDAMASLNQSLREQIQRLEETAAELGAMQQELEQRMQSGAAALAEAKASAARAIEERLRLDAELSQARADAEAETRRSSAEMARLRASLQVETLHRHRLESEAVQARSRLGEAERAGGSAVTHFQLRMRSPVATLVQSVGRLLEKDLPPEHRELAETVLTNAALVQTGLQDLGNRPNARRTTAPSTAATPATTAGDANPPTARSNSESILQPIAQHPANDAAANRQF